MSTDGDATLGIPAGALTDYALITVEPVDDGSLSDEALYVPGTGYRLRPDGLQFAKPVHLEIRYDPADLPPGMVAQRLRVRERIQDAWNETAGNRVEVQAHTVEAELEHFSIYALVGIDEATIAVTSVTIDHGSLGLSPGESHQLVATANGEDGFPVDRPFTWSSSDGTVISVRPDGTVTGNLGGSAVITAEADGFSGTANVFVPAASVAIDPIGSDPLEAGGTLQLVAHAYDAVGAEMAAVFAWTSSNDGIASVDQAGVVTGEASGSANITASVGPASATLEVKVVGDTETAGNNLSWPVVFAEGVGVTGLPVTTDPGVRPLTTEAAAYAELSAIAPTNPSAAFFYSGNAPDVETYYLQGTANTWRSQIVDGTGQAPYDAAAAWGDNLAGDGNLGVDHPIRVEVALSTTDGVTLLGYNMPYVVNPSSPDEMQGTDGTTGALTPLIYSAGPTLIIEQLSGPGGEVIATVSSAPIGAEVNVGGRLIYGAQFRPTAVGTYRLRFQLATEANVRITESDAVVLSPRETAIEIQVTP